jgi:hypothetical protein
MIANNLKVKGLVVKLLEFNRIFVNCFQIGKIVRRVHGPVDYGRAWSTGPWLTIGGGSRKTHRSPALWPLRWGNPCRRLGKSGRDQRGSSPAATLGGGGMGFDVAVVMHTGMRHSLLRVMHERRGDER